MPCSSAATTGAVDKDYDLKAQLFAANTAASFIAASIWKTKADFKSIAIEMQVHYKVKGHDDWRQMSGYALLTPITPVAPIVLHKANMRSDPTPYWNLFVIKSSTTGLKSKMMKGTGGVCSQEDAKEIFEELAKQHPDEIEHYSGKFELVEE